ncbi:ubiquitin-conjugating enzyme [Xylariomycetidae sp. FL2044]|nr:ubiquitin-conjugating enzyme [Xylariomycetidae sp. FL2044]
MASQKRISKELQECSTSPPPGMTVSLPNESDLHTWSVALSGPAQTPYEGGRFKLSVSLPPDYPFKAPQVHFRTRIWHPNVTNDSAGAICLSALKPENWKPASRVRGVLEAVRQLLVEPNPDDPLEARIADEFRQDRKAFDKNAREFVRTYAQ